MPNLTLTSTWGATLALSACSSLGSFLEPVSWVQSSETSGWNINGNKNQNICSADEVCFSQSVVYFFVLNTKGPGRYKEQKRHGWKCHIFLLSGHSILLRHCKSTFWLIKGSPACPWFAFLPHIRSEFCLLYYGNSGALFQETFVFMANPMAFFRSRKSKQHLTKMWKQKPASF